MKLLGCHDDTLSLRGQHLWITEVPVHIPRVSTTSLQHIPSVYWHELSPQADLTSLSLSQLPRHVSWELWLWNISLSMTSTFVDRASFSLHSVLSPLVAASPLSLTVHWCSTVDLSVDHNLSCTAKCLRLCNVVLEYNVSWSSFKCCHIRDLCRSWFKFTVITCPEFTVTVLRPRWLFSEVTVITCPEITVTMCTANSWWVI